MIRGSADRNRLKSIFSGNPAQIRPKLWLFVGPDYVATILGGEDTMNQVRNIRMGHRLLFPRVSRPYGTVIRFRFDPALKRRAIIGVPSGTDGPASYPPGTSQKNPSKITAGITTFVGSQVGTTVT